MFSKRINSYLATTITAVFLILLFYPLMIFAKENKTNVFFLHHSVGDSLVRDGSVRAILREAGFEFWDHERNNEKYGLRNEKGEPAGCYWIPDDNTYPDGLAKLFTMKESEDNALTRIVNNHDIIIFKSCFPANNLEENDPTLDAGDIKRRSISNYKHHYSTIRKTIDKYPDKIFIIVTSPPLHPNATDKLKANRAMAFAQWIKSKEFIEDRKNLFVFDYFSLLADHDSNTLKREFQIDPNGKNSHPNALAQMLIGPCFADFIINTAKFGRSLALSDVYFDNTIKQRKLRRLSDPFVNLSGRVTSGKNVRKVTWTNVSGERGELSSKDFWELKGVRVRPGVTTFIVTAIDNFGLRSSAVCGVQYYSGEKKEAIIFNESYSSMASVFGATVENDPAVSGSQKIFAIGTGKRKLFGMKDCNLDISDFDPKRTCLEISYDQGSDSHKPRIFLLGIGSAILDCDNKPGFEKLTIPLSEFQYVTNRLKRFVLRGEWDEQTKIQIDSIQLVCYGR